MTDTAAQPTTAADGVDAKQQVPPLVIVNQYIKDLSFENPNAPGILNRVSQPPQVTVHVDVRTAKLQDLVFEVTLHLKAQAKLGDQDAFLVELAYGGIVKLHEQVEQKHHAALLFIEAPRQLFPFVRQIVSNASQGGAFPPLLIQPVDFADLFRRQVEAYKKAKDEGATKDDLLNAATT